MKFTPLALAASLMFTATAQANESVIRKALTQQFPAPPSPGRRHHSGLFEAYLDGQLIYIDAKAQYVFAGDVIDLKNRANLTQARLNQLQAIKWDSLPLNNALKTVKGNGERKLAVFSDVDCPYCRKFEAELAKVDNITVYTFLYPIEGLHPKAGKPQNRSGARPPKQGGTTTYPRQRTENEQCANRSSTAPGNKLKISGTPH
jgi:thiol:disulfide interchange protein DsbC